MSQIVAEPSINGVKVKQLVERGELGHQMLLNVEVETHQRAAWHNHASIGAWRCCAAACPKPSPWLVGRWRDGFAVAVSTPLRTFPRRGRENRTAFLGNMNLPL